MTPGLPPREKLSQGAADDIENNQRCCTLLISDLATEGPQALYVMRRWLPLIFVIQGRSAFLWRTVNGTADRHISIRT